MCVERALTTVGALEAFEILAWISGSDQTRLEGWGRASELCAWEIQEPHTFITQKRLQVHSRFAAFDGELD